MGNCFCSLFRHNFIKPQDRGYVFFCLLPSRSAWKGAEGKSIAATLPTIYIQPFPFIAIIFNFTCLLLSVWLRCPLPLLNRVLTLGPFPYLRTPAVSTPIRLKQGFLCSGRRPGGTAGAALNSQLVAESCPIRPSQEANVANVAKLMPFKTKRN